MAASTGHAMTSVFGARQEAIDFTVGRDSLAGLARLFRRVARPLAVIILLFVVLISVTAGAMSLWPARQLLFVAADVILAVGAVAGMCWQLAYGKHRAETASAAKSRLLAALGEDLRKPLRAMARAGATIDRDAFDAGEWDKIARMRLDARAMLLQLEDIRTCLDIESGSFAPETRSFDLYRLANGVVASIRPQAAERGITISLRIDPQLPFQLRGWPHQLRQVLIGLLTHAVRQSGRTKLQLALNAIDVAATDVVLRIAVTIADTDPLERDIEALPLSGEAGRPFGLAMVERLIALMGGRLAAKNDPRGGCLCVDLRFVIDQAMQSLPLDLAHLPALIVTKDQNFVGEFVEPLDAWRADARWIGAGDTALQYLAGFDGLGHRPLVIVDGRDEVLQALSFAHRAAAMQAGAPPYLLFVADEARMDSIIGLADEDFDGILPAPFTVSALRGVLHAMRVEPADWFLADDALPVADEEPPAPALDATAIASLEPDPLPAPAAIVTEIAAHPRFAEAGAAIIDERAIGALWSLGDDGRFFDGVIEAFRADSRRILAELSDAAAAADARSFEEGVQALRHCTANFGSGRLRELLLSLRDLAPAELQRQGAAHVQRLSAEIGKLDTMLVDYAKAAR